MLAGYRVHGVVLLVLAAASAPSFGELAEVTVETSLRPEPGSGPIRGLLTPTTPVEVLERRDGWARVRLEGWVRTDAVAGASPPEASRPLVAPDAPVVPVVPAPTPPAVPRPDTARATRPPAPTPLPAPVVSSSAIEGLIRIEQRRRFGRKKAAPVAGVPVLLLPAASSLDATPVSEASQEKIASLESEAARLAERAKKAMHGSNFTESMAERDGLMDQRAALLDERLDLLAAEHGRREQAARSGAVASAVTDSKGWFTVDAPPGTYTLYARWTDVDLDYEWVKTVRLEGGRVRVDLDSKDAHGVLPDPK